MAGREGCSSFPWWEGVVLNRAKAAQCTARGATAWVGTATLLFAGFISGSWVQNKLCFCSAAAEHVLFSPATCKDFLLTRRETFWVSSLRGIFKSMQFWKLVLFFFSYPKRKEMKKRQKII